MPTAQVSLPLLSQLPPPPTSFITYHDILRKQIRKLRSKIGLKEPQDYSKVEQVFRDNDKTVLSDTDKINHHIWLLVLNAERAWAQGMQLKTEYQTGSSKSSVKRHSQKRFAKAAKWARFVKDHCSQFLDERGVIEVESYENWLQATYALETEDYANAAKLFSEARSVYAKLKEVGALQARSVYAKRCSEIDNLIKYCQYELTRKSGDSGEIQVIQNLLTDEDTAQMLNNRLESVLEEERKKQAASMETVQFLGEEIPVQNERVRVAILKAQGLEKNLPNQKSNEGKLKMYERLLLAYDEGMRILQEDVRKNSTNEEFVQQSRLLNTFLSYNHLMSIVNRNELLVEKIVRQMSRDDSNQGPQDVAHLYDVILQNVEEISDLPQIDSSADMMDTLEAKRAYYRSFKVYYLAMSYQKVNKVREAYALLKKALSTVSAAKAKTRNQQDLLSKLNKLEEQSKRSLLQVHSQNYLDSENSKVRVSKSVMSNMDQYPSDNKIPELIAFPPSFERIPCKPMFFDIAGNNVEVPSFKEEASQKKGWFGIW